MGHAHSTRSRAGGELVDPRIEGCSGGYSIPAKLRTLAAPVTGRRVLAVHSVIDAGDRRSNAGSSASSDLKFVLGTRCPYRSFRGTSDGLEQT
jgi:hypothetical protein